MPPVIDHEIHPRTVDTGVPNGCHNRPPMSPGYWAMDRQYRPGGKWEIVPTWIPHRLSTECRYDLSLTDAKCAGCLERGQGEARSERIRRDGS